ncbi:MAG: T9SS type A sorting domain-containing protein, partial [Bacteroidales bacterium]|nr:T9SS type A sorting domain-containing protein [Bacteroidales bacterium]
AFDFPRPSNYDGATPRGMPEDDFNALAAADGKLLAVNQYCTQITRQGIEITKNPDNQKFTVAFYNPYNSSQYFLGGSDGILYEYVDGNLKASYNNIVGAPIVSMDCNQSGDLFILSASENSPVHVFDHNGKWHVATSFNSMKSSSPKQILFISENIVVVNTGTNGIFAVDLGDTPLDFSDDQAVVRQIVSGGARVGTVITSMMLSQSGSLYVGTDKGVAYTLTPESLVEGGAGFIRPISTETNDRDGSYSQYLSSSKTVTCIAEDAAGRKWFGTKSAGVFVVNEDCDEEVMRFNVRNSPLPSDTIIALEIVQNTGEVFMATANGLASYISDAQKSADDLDNILVYPNPVRPGYDGDIHISGLESGSDVRITDIAGHLVHKATSDSGLLSWDGNNLNGRRCASGVYLIFVFNVETGDKKVKKLLIIR